MLSDIGLASGELMLLIGLMLLLGIGSFSFIFTMARPVPGEGICTSKHLARDIDHLEPPAQSLLLQPD